jgi:periplasmic protein TonB
VSLATSPGRQLQPDGEPSKPEDRQRQRLILALVLFLCAIGVVAYKVITTVSGSQPEMEAVQTVPSATTTTETAAANATAASGATAPSTSAAAPVTTDLPSRDSSTGKTLHEKHKSPATKPAPPNAETASLAPTVTRKVLPPLAVEVFAGGRPVPLQSKPTVAVHVDTSNGVQGRAATPGGDATVAGGSGPSDPSRVRISPEALQVLSHPVDPNYPLLAREMKVQGSVILDAFIGRDGSIQALKIVSGPTILATAAMEAVRQWRFKPYLQAGQAVETEARITVNFTISTT